MDTTSHSAAALADLIAAGILTASEVVDAHLARIEALNPKLNAFIYVDAAGARAAARDADLAVRAGRPLGPLHGVPVSIKSSVSVAGMPWETGSRNRRGVRGEIDAPLVTRLRAAGAIVLGVTNVAEQLMAWETDNALYGRTSSPWDLGRTPGGSSGGEAAAIAAGLSAGGVGSDGGGSIRVPAHFTGIVGLKPTPGRVPATGHFPPCAGPFALTGVVGPMARTVEDVELLLRVMAGPDSGDPNGHPVELFEGPKGRRAQGPTDGRALPRGLTGVDGGFTPGHTRLTGDAGARGEFGQALTRGLTGADGGFTPGHTRLTGDAGARGEFGQALTRGLTGADGGFTSGPTRLTGDAGARGEFGQALTRGLTGPDGGLTPGHSGLTPGHSGLTGHAGSPGEHGEALARGTLDALLGGLPTIGYFEDDGRTPVTPDTRLAIRRAAQALSDAGWPVEAFRPEGLDEARELWWEIFGRASRLLLEPMIAGRESEVHPNLPEFLEWTRRTPPLTATRLLEVEIRRDLLRARFAAQMERYNLLLCPVSAVTAFRHGEREWVVEGQVVHYLDAWSYTAWFNLLQNPAVSVPAGLSSEGLPIGVQVVARPWHELDALAAARAIEQRLGGYLAPPLS